jgi:hypothetical protein
MARISIFSTENLQINPQELGKSAQVTQTHHFSFSVGATSRVLTWIFWQLLLEIDQQNCIETG